MKFNLEIENLLKVTGDIQWLNGIPFIPPHPNPYPKQPINKVIEWYGEDLELEGGVKYYITTHIIPKIQNKKITIKSKGTGRADLFFGVEGMSKWSGNHPSYLFDIENDVEITIKDVNIYTVKVANEVDPFYHTIFAGTGLNQKLNLINVDTNMQVGLLYSASQDVTQVLYQENVTFKGYQYQALKANNGGGLKSIIRGAKLNQIDPPTYFKSSFVFSRNDVVSDIPFSLIENDFHSNQKKNSCNILYVEGLTFYLPWGLELSHKHKIRPIPEIGERIYLYQGIEFLQTDEWELQAGDIIEINGKEYPIISKDRAVGDEFKDSDYSINYNIGVDINDDTEAVVKKSQGLGLIGKKTEGYMIFKYNKHFQTHMDKKYDLSHFTSSNPIGVLSYNHEEITIDWKDLDHDGFYRQSKSGVGKSNNYKLDSVTGLKDQFKIPSYLVQLNEHEWIPDTDNRLTKIYPSR